MSAQSFNWEDNDIYHTMGLTAQNKELSVPFGRTVAFILISWTVNDWLGSAHHSLKDCGTVRGIANKYKGTVV